MLFTYHPLLFCFIWRYCLYSVEFHFEMKYIVINFENIWIHNKTDSYINLLNIGRMSILCAPCSFKKKYKHSNCDNIPATILFNMTLIFYSYLRILERNCDGRFHHQNNNSFHTWTYEMVFECLSWISAINAKKPFQLFRICFENIEHINVLTTGIEFVFFWSYI